MTLRGDGPLGVFALLGGGCIRDVLSGTDKKC